MDISNRQQQIIIQLLLGKTSLQDLLGTLGLSDVTSRTIQRDLAELEKKNLIKKSGKARATIYAPTKIGLFGLTFNEVTLSDIFKNEERENIGYDFDRLNQLRDNPLFSKSEIARIEKNDEIFKKKNETAPRDILRRERERITIELSWKSSQIEGNTYSLLETESLLKEGVVAPGKSKDETQMIVNHKKALDFSEENKAMFTTKITKSLILELHKILGEDLIEPGLRERIVGITGSVYKPLDNKHQINEELENLCNVITNKENIYEKALVAFIYICYLQPFNDGNKRTARILANAILNAGNSFPLSLRGVSVSTYKLAILAYYELGSLGNAKKVFLGQARFAVENYAA